MDTVRSACLGAVFGACIGDALGAPIEFQLQVTDEQLSEALAMKGGGTHGTGEGQVTDDSEMAMCIARALVKAQGRLDLDCVVMHYSGWERSQPFGMGATCGNALRALNKASDCTAAVCIDAAKRLNQGSQSNGTLMRMTPLCVWAHNLPPSKAAHAARLEASLTHSNETIHHANACYLLAVQHLINYLGDRPGAYLAAKEYARTQGNEDIRQWFEHIEQEQPLIECQKIGWAKIGFTYAFRHLRNGDDYMTAVRNVLSIGGDTDTNAAIVGGLIGAAVGYEGLPQEYVSKVQTFTHARNGGIWRPEFLNQPDMIGLVDQLITIAPFDSTVVIALEESDL